MTNYRINGVGAMVKIVVMRWGTLKEQVIHDVQNRTRRADGDVIYVEDVETFRKLITPERLRLLSAITHKKPDSIYQLAKMLKKDFKTVSGDVDMFRNVGLVRVEKYKDGLRNKSRPVAAMRKIQMELTV